MKIVLVAITFFAGNFSETKSPVEFHTMESCERARFEMQTQLDNKPLQPASTTVFACVKIATREERT